jgi:hypothetical protein
MPPIVSKGVPPIDQNTYLGRSLKHIPIRINPEVESGFLPGVAGGLMPFVPYAGAVVAPAAILLILGTAKQPHPHPFRTTSFSYFRKSAVNIGAIQ